MTVTRPLAAPAAVNSPEAARELRTVSGVIVAGSLNGDVIIATHEAMSIVRAGKLVRAFIIAGLESILKTATLGGGRTVKLEFGMYRATS